jgi:hypothetical protein
MQRHALAVELAAQGARHAAAADVAGERRARELGEQALLQAAPACAPPGPIQIWAEYQGMRNLPADLRKKLTDTVEIALKVLQKYLSVKCPPQPPFRVAPQCTKAAVRQDGSLGFCVGHEPDMLGAGDKARASRTCGLASINASHIAPYKDCAMPDGQACKRFRSECSKGLRGSRGDRVRQGRAVYAEDLGG